MKYTFKILDIHNKKKLITNFEDRKYICLEDILNSDSMSVEQIIECIDLVISKKVASEEIGNERCTIEITGECAEIYDAFIGLIDDSELYPTIKMPTIEFRSFLIFWENEKKEFLNTSKK